MSIGNKIFEFKRPELESRVDQYFKARPWIEPSPSIDIEEIFLRTQIIKKQEVAPLLFDLFRTEAMIFAPLYMRRELTVVFDQGITDARDGGRYRMAMAEEIGHTELHLSVILDVHDSDDFRELQQCPQWAMGENDAKYFGRAVLMPRRILEDVARSTYKRIVNEVGFADYVQFQRLFTTHIASQFDVPWREAEKRISEFVGGLQMRVDRSFASRNLSLLETTDELVVKPPHFSAKQNGKVAPG